MFMCSKNLQGTKWYEQWDDTHELYSSMLARLICLVCNSGVECSGSLHELALCDFTWQKLRRTMRSCRVFRPASNAFGFEWTGIPKTYQSTFIKRTDVGICIKNNSHCSSTTWIRGRWFYTLKISEMVGNNHCLSKLLSTPEVYCRSSCWAVKRAMMTMTQWKVTKPVSSMSQHSSGHGFCNGLKASARVKKPGSIYVASFWTLPVPSTIKIQLTPPAETCWNPFSIYQDLFNCLQILKSSSLICCFGLHFFVHFLHLYFVVASFFLWHFLSGCIFGGGHFFKFWIIPGGMPQHSTWRLDWWSGGNPVPRRIQEWQMVYLPILMVCNTTISL